MTFDAPDSEALEILQGVERSADVRNALAHLTLEEVAVIALKYGFLYSVRDIAHVLHLPLAEVTRLRLQALCKIRERLE